MWLPDPLVRAAMEPKLHSLSLLGNVSSVMSNWVCLPPRPVLNGLVVQKQFEINLYIVTVDESEIGVEILLTELLAEAKSLSFIQRDKKG